MLASRHRFHRRNDIQRAFKRSQSRRGRLLMVRVAPPRQEVSRVAVIVSKKIYKSAVKRNRIRRRVYDIVRHNIPLTGKPYDIIIMVTSPESLTVDAGSLTAEITKLYSMSSGALQRLYS